MEYANYIIVFFTVMVSAAVQRCTGFGFGIIVMAVLPIFLPYRLCQGISASLSIILTASILVKMKRPFRLKPHLVIIPSIFAAIGVLCSLFLMSSTPSAIYKRLLGVFLFVLAIWFWRFSAKVKIPATPLSAAVAGSVSGVCSGLFSISGPPMVLYYLSAIDDMHAYMAATQLYFFILQLVVIPSRMILGLWPQDLLPYFLCGLVGLFLGIFGGSYLSGRIPQKKIKMGIYVFMSIAGLYIAIAG